METPKFNYWRDRFINLGYSDKQVTKLLKYPRYVLQHVHESGYVNPDMNCRQIEQVMIGLAKNYLSIFVKCYAKNEYPATYMRVMRLLLNLGLDSDYIDKYMDIKKFSYKQCFVLGMVLINSKEVNIDLYIDFIQKADKQVDELYRLFNPRVSGSQYDKTPSSFRIFKKDIISRFDKDFYAAQIEYKLEMVS